ncbi:GGDEF domain-containing protein [Marinobacter halodurans]|uniref:diguanylate cyclase n=1 Tax=Marinobacter halodurans TaxID=2528979 RepID=A0ABY1ZNW8_9GAMM|nr:diguanylate cyclase [Marinobacter halodurans]TBW58216.1 GGDEF domain-containing protein [Marinobacter halodurans]
MTTKEAGQKDWQEERYTLQRLLVRTSLFASGQDDAIDKLLGDLRNVLRHETCDLGTLRQVQARLDQALERLDEKRSRSERDLHQALERLLEQVEEDEGPSRKQFRSLEKRIADLGPDNAATASWLAELAGLLEAHRDTLDQPEDRGWRRFFSRQQREKPAGPDVNPSPAGTTNDSDDDSRVRIARRVGELLEHVLNQVTLEPTAHARAQHLKQLLDQSMAWPELRDALNEIVDLVIDAVSRSRNEFEAFLRRLDDRLAALRANCQVQAEARQDQRDASERLNQAVNSRLESMGQAVETAATLDDLKASVTQSIQFLSASFRTYREDECRRETILENELATMQERLAGMEAYSEQVQEQLRAERSHALTDMLTQLPNREAWQQRLQLEFDRWLRYQHPASLAILDIDHFKAVNDSFGHKAGDRVIQLVAKVLCDRVRATDFVARYGGEEFVLLLPETGVDQARIVIDDLREHIADLPFHFQDKPVSITISAGLVAFDRAETAEALFDLADKALYQAKDAGRNRVILA